MKSSRSGVCSSYWISIWVRFKSNWNWNPLDLGSAPIHWNPMWFLYNSNWNPLDLGSAPFLKFLFEPYSTPIEFFWIWGLLHSDWMFIWILFKSNWNSLDMGSAPALVIPIWILSKPNSNPMHMVSAPFLLKSYLCPIQIQMKFSGCGVWSILVGFILDAYSNQTKLSEIWNLFNVCRIPTGSLFKIQMRSSDCGNCHILMGFLFGSYSNPHEVLLCLHSHQ